MSSLKNPCALEDLNCLRQSSWLSQAAKLFGGIPYLIHPWIQLGSTLGAMQPTIPKKCKAAKCNERKTYELKLELTKNLIISRNDPTTCKGSKEGLGQTAVRQQTRKMSKIMTVGASEKWKSVQN